MGGRSPQGGLESSDPVHYIIDGALQGSLDEVVLLSLMGFLGQGLVGNEVGVGVDQAPLGADEVLIILSVVGSQEPISLFFDPSQLGGVSK